MQTESNDFESLVYQAASWTEPGIPLDPAADTDLPDIPDPNNLLIPHDVSLGAVTATMLSTPCLQLLTVGYTRGMVWIGDYYLTIDQGIEFVRLLSTALSYANRLRKI